MGEQFPKFRNESRQELCNREAGGGVAVSISPSSQSRSPCVGILDWLRMGSFWECLTSLTLNFSIRQSSKHSAYSPEYFWRPTKMS